MKRVLPAAHPGNLFDAVRTRRMRRRAVRAHLGAEVPGHGLDARIIGGDNHALTTVRQSAASVSERRHAKWRRHSEGSQGAATQSGCFRCRPRAPGLAHARYNADVSDPRRVVPSSPFASSSSYCASVSSLLSFSSSSFSLLPLLPPSALTRSLPRRRPPRRCRQAPRQCSSAFMSLSTKPDSRRWAMSVGIAMVNPVAVLMRAAPIPQPEALRRRPPTHRG